jgi:predicted amidohydrolase YtcJ
MNHRNSRREFLNLTGAGIATLAGGAWPGTAAAAEGPDADLVVFNARVYTVDSRAPKAEAFAVKAGQFSAVGSTSEMKALIGKRTQTFDAKQMVVVPGFIDCHNHAPGDVLLFEVIVGNPYLVEFVTIDSIVAKLRGKAAKTPPGTWVEGYFFDDTKVKDNRLLNVHDLDKVSKDHPVVVHHRGGHTSFYNSKALEMADINNNTPNPPGGTYDRDTNDALNGRVTDRARTPFNRAGKRPSYTAEQTLQRNREGLAFISKRFVRYGVTSVHHEGGDLFALQQVRARGDLLHR